MTIKPLAEEVNLRLRAAVKYDSEDDHAKALAAIDDARKSMQDLFYQVWLKHHQSGTVKGDR